MNLSPRRHRIALLLLASAILVNEWTLGWMFANDGSVDDPGLLVVRASGLLMLTLAALAAFTRLSPARLYRDGAVTVVSALLLFVALNLMAMATVKGRLDKLFYGPLELLWTNPDALHSAHATRDHAAIVARVSSPGSAAHPSLQSMMRPTQSHWYNSGPEGSRRGCRAGQQADIPIDGAIWLFGGSTAYGTGVGDCETIASALNDLDPDNGYLNFGAEARNQNNEIEHLLLLLRKGYRPKRVWFLDGLNDILLTTLRVPNLHPQEVPAIIEQPYYYSLANDRGAFWSNLLKRLPLMPVLTTQVATHQEMSGCDQDDGGVYTPGSDFHESPLRHHAAQLTFQTQIAEWPASRIPKGMYARCDQRLLALYRANGDFIGALARAFDFQARVYFQPLVMLLDNNPFAKPAFRDSALRALTQHLQNTVRAEIAAGHLPGFVDITRAGMDCTRCTVDGSHYTQEVARAIADAILIDTGTTPTAVPPPS